MSCEKCGGYALPGFKLCHQHAKSLDKCAKCGGSGRYPGFVICEGCAVAKYGRCGCGAPKSEGCCMAACGR